MSLRHLVRIFGALPRQFRTSCHRSNPHTRLLTISQVRQCSGTSKKPEDSFSERTHNCGELRASDENKRVVLYGWLNFKRSRFMVLRDHYGLTQMMIDGNLVTEMAKVPFESVIRAEGVVKQRPEKDKRGDSPTGDIEVHVDAIQIINPCRKDMPFLPRSFQAQTEALQNEFRYITLRDPGLQAVLVKRAKLVKAFRDYLGDKLKFIEVETPTLFCRTPGGAKEFPVACHSSPGEFYSLTQSPQQFKQLLMVAGLDRYYQVARCYRDEMSRPDRQPEFTQIDLEMSFVTERNLIAMLEELVTACWPEPIAQTPFPVIKYEDAMNLYGTDQPDIRYEMLLEDHPQLIEGPIADGHIIKFIRVHDESLELGELMAEWKRQSVLSGFTCDIDIVSNQAESGSLKGVNTDYLREQGCRFVVARGLKREVLTTLGKIRQSLAGALKILAGKENEFHFAWVVDFPLFSLEDGVIESTHHPFTAPAPGQESLLNTAPLECRAQHFDLILNGWEVGGGSIRVHSSEMQRMILEDILKQDASQLKHLLEALASGAPPHGGFAFGLDRLVAILCRVKTIREVMAFPKTSEGRCLMSGAPVELTEEELKYSNIRVREKQT